MSIVKFSDQIEYFTYEIWSTQKPEVETLICQHDLFLICVNKDYIVLRQYYF